MSMPDAPSKRRWDSENTIVFSIKLMRRTDADIIAFLEKKLSQGVSKGSAIKTALREYMANHPEEGGEQ